VPNEPVDELQISQPCRCARRAISREFFKKSIDVIGSERRQRLPMAQAVSKRTPFRLSAKSGLLDRPISASRHLGRGKGTPQNPVILSFDTASADKEPIKARKHRAVLNDGSFGEGSAISAGGFGALPLRIRRFGMARPECQRHKSIY
jgi:hypothetical protein